MNENSQIGSERKYFYNRGQRGVDDGYEGNPNISNSQKVFN
jgi:hypothetical protein